MVILSTLIEFAQLGLFNFYQINKLIELYKNESKHIKNIRGWYLVLTLLVVIFLPVFLGYIKRN